MNSYQPKDLALIRQVLARFTPARQTPDTKKVVRVEMPLEDGDVPAVVVAHTGLIPHSPLQVDPRLSPLSCTVRETLSLWR